MSTPPARPRHVARLERGHPFRQWKTWPIEGTALTLTGYSRANDKTFFHIPELACCIDAGLCEGRSVDTVLLTHTHQDHASDIEFLSTQRDGRIVYAPAESIDYLARYIQSRSELNFHAAIDPARARSYQLIGVADGATLPVGRKQEYQVRVVTCLHKIPCVGYCFSERRTRLLPDVEARRAELLAAGRQRDFGAWIATQRKAGVAVDEEHLVPRFAFLGDTSPEVFARNPWLFEYPVIVTECTFLDDSERARAALVGHTVWSELRPVVAAHPQTRFVLIHFSLRHSDRQVVEFFADQHNFHDNVIVWAHPDSTLPELHQPGS